MFDSHAHYDSKEFDADRNQIINSVHDEGVEYILNAGSNLKNSKVSVELSEKYEYIFAAVGVHPHDSRKLDKDYIDSLIGLSKNNKVVAIGEIGLDYFYDFSPKEVQKKCFLEQLDLAKELNLPVIVHDRDAHEDIMKSLKESNIQSVGGILHCFSGSLEMAKELVKMGLCLGIGGPVTFNNARKLIEVVQNIPIEYLLSETDCPYLTPVPFRGQRNNSGYMRHTIEKIAEIKKMDFEEVVQILTQNAKRLFKIT